MNKIITAAMVAMLGLPTLTIYTMFNQAAEIKQLRQDVDAHTNLISVRAALGAPMEVDVLKIMVDAPICDHASMAIKNTCDSAKALNN